MRLSLQAFFKKNLTTEVQMITSSSNEQLKHIVQLNTKAGLRRETGTFAAEGLRIFREIPESYIEKVFVSESFSKENEALLADIPYEIVADHLFAKISDTRTPQGILTVARMPEYEREDLLGENPLILVLEDLQDPGNVGTILRTAEGAGVTGIFMNSQTADPFQPKVVRATMGSIFRVPFLREENLEETAEWLKKQGVRVYAADLAGSVSCFAGDYTKGTAFLIGNEGNGLTGELVSHADQRIRIPMKGQLESLNAAVSAAILAYTAAAQRE